ncbi:MAG: penicillin-binding transpeptidase domain-containing protein, partial [Gammaproteobacteria bacterium]
ISSEAYKALNDSENQPLYNRALRGLYPPGSTIKPFIALAGLEYDKIRGSQSLYCPGYYTLPGVNHRYRDWRKGGHGSVDMIRAITESCDVYFYRLAQMLGIQHMHDFLQQFGFGEKSGIDLYGEVAGLLPSPAWKRARKKQKWYEGETLITGIGQGYHQVTPLQLARATATLANHGEVVTPFMVDKVITAQGAQKGSEKHGEIIPLKAEHLDTIFAGMINVVHSASGTAKRIGYGIPYQIAGKTGTAQVFGIKQGAKYNESEIDFKLRDNALFVAFAPADDPKIAVAVVVEHGGHGGSVAAPIAGKVIKQYLQSLHEN